MIYEQDILLVDIQRQGKNPKYPLKIDFQSFMSQARQNVYPFSNSVFLRTNIQNTKNFGLGSGVLVTINAKKYIATVCHNLNKQQHWYNVTAFLKPQTQLSKNRTKTEVKKEMIKFDYKFAENKKEPRYQIALIEIQTQKYKEIQNNKAIQILFDFNKQCKEEIYLMGFPYKLNFKQQKINQIQEPTDLHLLFRKLDEIKFSKDKKILNYKTSTEQGESGGALMIKKQINGQTKYYLIGLHVGTGKNKEKQYNQVYNFGVLFTSDTKSTFYDIFWKRSSPQKKIDSDCEEQIIDRLRKMRLLNNGDTGENINYKSIHSNLKNFECIKKTKYYITGDNDYQKGKTILKCGTLSITENFKRYFCYQCFVKNYNNQIRIAII